MGFDNYIEKKELRFFFSKIYVRKHKHTWGWTVSTLDVEAEEAGRGSRNDLVNQ